MKRSVYLFSLLLTFSLLPGCGCTLQSTADAPNMVAKITVEYDQGYYQYDTSPKIRAILNYLRWIDPYGKPESDPEAASGPLYRITLHLSGGGQRVYLQKADQYMRIDGGPWLSIDPDRALTLSQIISGMKSDPGA